MIEELTMGEAMDNERAVSLFVSKRHHQHRLNLLAS